MSRLRAGRQRDTQLLGNGRHGGDTCKEVPPCLPLPSSLISAVRATQAVLAAFEALADEYVQAEDARKRLSLNPNAFAVYTALRPLAPDLSAEQARAVDAVFARYPEYGWNAQQQAKLRAELYKALRTLVGAAKMIEAANALLRLQRAQEGQVEGRDAP